jgi:hypothetical protein
MLAACWQIDEYIPVELINVVGMSDKNQNQPFRCMMQTEDNRQFMWGCATAPLMGTCWWIRASCTRRSRSTWQTSFG